jgi:hypothetical protein
MKLEINEAIKMIFIVEYARVGDNKVSSNNSKSEKQEEFYLNNKNKK